MATSVEKSEKEVQIDKVHANTFLFVKNIVKIGPAGLYPEIIGLRSKKKKKLRKVKYIARAASLLSGLKKLITIFI